MLKIYLCGIHPIEIENFEKEILYKFRTLSSWEISNILDVSEGLENLIIKSLSENYNIYDLIKAIKSKRYTQTRIQRILIHCLLGITTNFANKYKLDAKYARVLGLSKNGKKLLSSFSKNSEIPIITSVSSFYKKCGDEEKEILDKDILATNIYTLGYEIPEYRKINLDFTMPIIS